MGMQLFISNIKYKPQGKLTKGLNSLSNSVNMTVLICNTGAAASVGLGDVEVQIDSVFLSKSQTFTYVEDPRLERISRNKAIVR